jgi:UDP-N-acetylglucosamine 2-epimerase (non-hydrolysing)/GDP/UDP-N,N'-diacetylbacillosamine 2-epimerase (hydrolysing)
VTYHPVTLDDQGPQKTMGELFQALDAYPEANIIITKPNADTNGRIICAMIDAYAAQWPDRVKASISLGQIIYLSALQYVDVVIGNSSSGLIEAPTFRKPTVNLGDRQKGRLRADSVLDCSENKKDIQAAIQKALSPDFRKMLDHVKSPYEYDNASQQIKNYLRDIVLHGLLKKTFYDGAGYK